MSTPEDYLLDPNMSFDLEALMRMSQAPMATEQMAPQLDTRSSGYEAPVSDPEKIQQLGFADNDVSGTIPLNARFAQALAASLPMIIAGLGGGGKEALGRAAAGAAPAIETSENILQNQAKSEQVRQLKRLEQIREAQRLQEERAFRSSERVARDEAAMERAKIGLQKTPYGQTELNLTELEKRGLISPETANKARVDAGLAAVEKPIIQIEKDKVGIEKTRQDLEKERPLTETEAQNYVANMALKNPGMDFSLPTNAGMSRKELSDLMMKQLEQQTANKYKEAYDEGHQRRMEERQIAVQRSGAKTQQETKKIERNLNLAKLPDNLKPAPGKEDAVGNLMSTPKFSGEIFNQTERLVAARRALKDLKAKIEKADSTGGLLPTIDKSELQQAGMYAFLATTQGSSLLKGNPAIWESKRMAATLPMTPAFNDYFERSFSEAFSPGSRTATALKLLDNSLKNLDDQYKEFMRSRNLIPATDKDGVPQPPSDTSWYGDQGKLSNIMGSLSDPDIQVYRATKNGVTYLVEYNKRTAQTRTIGRE